jgi:ribosomal protein S6
MAVVDIGSSQQFEVVRIIFRTYSYPELSEISERFLILVVKANFSFTYLLHAERRYLVYEIKFRNNFKYIVINVLHK